MCECVCLVASIFFAFGVCAAEQPFLCGLPSALDFINTLFCLARSQRTLKCTEKIGRLFHHGGSLRGCVGTPRTRATFFSWTRKLWIILGLPASTRRSWSPDSENSADLLVPWHQHGRPETPGNQYLLSLFSLLFPVSFFSFLLSQQLHDTE